MSTRWLFVDMNSYFASVEQQLQPTLRGRPVAIIPMMAETTCCIAASYEAKAFGIKTGTQVADARLLCPRIQFVIAQTENYVRLHHEIVKAVESVIPVHQVYSIDEMACELWGAEQQEATALKLGQQVKEAIKDQVGECLHSSVGLAPNRMLAKVASNMQKPNGLTLIRLEELPTRLESLQLDDFPGIGSRMKYRLQLAGIHTTQQLCAASAAKLRNVWGGVVGERWWHLLRGEDLPEQETKRRTVGHSHVLPPDSRSYEGAYGVLVRMVDKAAVRLRKLNYWAGRLTVSIRFLERPKWEVAVKLGSVQDTQTMLMALKKLWAECPRTGIPYKAAITLDSLTSISSCAQPLFADDQRRRLISQTMDQVNQRMGTGALYLGAMHHSRQAAPDRIAFQSIPECCPQHPSMQKRSEN